MLRLGRQVKLFLQRRRPADNHELQTWCSLGETSASVLPSDHFITLLCSFDINLSHRVHPFHPLPTHLPSFGGTLGSLFIGMNVSTILYGVACAQTFLYATSPRSRKDGWILKGFVFALLPIDTAHHVTMFTGMYRYLITDYLNPSLSLDTNTGSGDFYVHIGGALSVVIVVLVQLYYAWRLWAFSINTSNALRCLLTVATVVLSLLTFTAGILIVARTFPKFQSEPSIFDTNGFSGLSWGLQLCSSIACDTVITFGMMLNLRRTRAGFRSTNDGLNFLMVLTLNTGLLTVTLCIVCLVCFYALQPQSNLAYAGLQILMPRCYIISFLATLNSREYLREKLVAGALSFGGSNPGSNQAGCRTHAANTSSAESENLANELVNVKIMYTTEKMVERDGSVEQDRIGRAVV